ncbi:MAG: SulP family inorganic anion transporter, partial [Chloroflexia bacterium]|nr:SulP family inorganic anion transporter [Chloroflexia bacterium]
MKVAGRVIVKRWPPAITIGDVAAGLSVALVLVPQSLAYAELAGLPAHVGLYAAAFPAIAASLFASSPYLQTGPTAMASLLTVGVVSAVVVADGQYAATAALLAILVGIARVLVGIFRSGRLAYLLSQTVLTGFASGAALLIIASQVPNMLGADPRSDGVLGGLASVSGRPDTWERESVLLALLTAILMVGGRRLHAYFPGALLAAVLGIGWSLVVGYTGPTIGDVPTGLPGLALNLPWG